MVVSEQGRPATEFAYMVWAKHHAVGAAFNLGQSGLAPPPNDSGFLGVDRLDLDRGGRDMPQDSRRAVAERFGAPDERVLLTLGTSHALYLIAAISLSEGDLCFVETPTYEALPGVAKLRGARVEHIQRRFEDGYRLPADLCERIGRERPRLVMLSNPHNPSGALLPPEDLMPVADAVAQVGGLLVVDEVYLEYLADAPTRSAHHLGDAVVALSSLTKAYGLGTVRFGWMLAQAALIERAIRYNDYIAVHYPVPSAWVGLGALKDIAHLQQRAQEVRERNLPIVSAWVASRSDVTWHPPEAGIIGFPRFARTIEVNAFCERLLERRQTLVVPGRYFGAPQHVRLGFGGEPDNLSEALNRVSYELDASS